MFPRVLLFLSTPSARRATRRCCSRRHCGQYFYPRPLRGGRPGERGNFQDAGDFYPRPLRGGRRGGLAAFNLQAAISIHALCEEGDDQGCQRQPEEHENFYPRPLRGGRLYPYEWSCTTHLFLSTPSARRATLPGRAYGLIYNISIHALCEEGDAIRRRCAATRPRFLSTPSARRATRDPSAVCCHTSTISIHALCEEGDSPWAIRPARNPYFYPRPLRGGRLVDDGHLEALEGFLSTPSARRATGMPLGVEPSQQISIHALCEEGDSITSEDLRCIRISIHALCEEGDLAHSFLFGKPGQFLSTPSARRATWKSRCSVWRTGYFYPRPLRGGRPFCRSLPSQPFAISIHALCEEGDRSTRSPRRSHGNFYPRPLRGGRRSCP